MRNIKVRAILSVIVMLLALISSQTAFADKNDPKIAFKESVYDFGKISLKEGKVSHKFSFTNQGGKNLVITNARADCGCTRPEYNDAPVAPGKGGEVKVTFAPAAKGHFSKKVTITTNGNPRKTRLIIKGEVVE